MGDTANSIAKQRSLADLIAEYDAKMSAIPSAIAAVDAAASALASFGTMGGEYGDVTLSIDRPKPEKVEESLRRAAWRYVWKGLNLDHIATAKDKTLFAQSMAADPPAFSMDNLRATLGPYLENPRQSILRGLAEVFADLDPAYASHEKMKIGVKGLPKRVIVGGCGGWDRSNRYVGYAGKDKARDIINALAAYQGKPLVSYGEMDLLVTGEGDALNEGGDHPHPDARRFPAGVVKVVPRGVWLKRFQNGNGHLFFGPEALRDINMALAEYYGDVLPDCPEDRPAKTRTGTAVSKDLQYYPTPEAVVKRLLREGDWQGKRVLEPSCGCGRIMDGLRKAGASVFGIEVDPGRSAECEAKGHSVMRWNFLDVQPNARTGMADFDAVVMNPPFYGRHYAKHVRHALRFLKPGGLLLAILPITARHDHGELDDLKPRWTDLPVGSFSASGTNINTTIARIRP